MFIPDTIIAISSPPGMGAIALIRLSGENSISIVNSVFSKELIQKKSHSAIYGEIKRNNGETLDEVVLTLFLGSKSFTGEPTVEIACHGSIYIQQEIIELLLEKGARLAKAGEFSQRAFLNQKLDLTQAEAISDLIYSESEAAHRMALHQMKGGFSNELKTLRLELLNFVSLIELELDFGEEDVEFANRNDLKNRVIYILAKINSLISSFKLGNAIKNGIPVAIVGKPNAGKSTLLNALLNEEKAIVSATAGTTRDVIEDTLQINGLLFRFMDTAGLRITEDEIEKIGVERAHAKMEQAQIILYLCSGATHPNSEEEGPLEAKDIAIAYQKKYPASKVILVANKIDLRNDSILWLEQYGMPLRCISAKNEQNIEELKQDLYAFINEGNILQNEGTILTNIRHVEALKHARKALDTVLEGLGNGLSADLIALDIRNSMAHIGSITGQIDTEEILGNIFGKFCIGK
jgi:tRNA modification GTPase